MCPFRILSWLSRVPHKIDFLSWKWSEHRSANRPGESQYSKSISVSANAERYEHTVQRMAEHILGERWPLWENVQKAGKKKTLNKILWAPQLCLFREKCQFEKRSIQLFSQIGDQTNLFYLKWPSKSLTASQIENSSCIVFKVLCWTYVDMNNILNMWHKSEVSAISRIFHLFWTTACWTSDSEIKG